MDKILIMILFICVSSAAIGQINLGNAELIIDRKLLTEINSHYITIFPVASITYEGIALRIIYEANKNGTGKLKSYLRVKSTGDKVFFESNTDALNFLFEKGYRIDQVLTNDIGDACSYILERYQ